MTDSPHTAHLATLTRLNRHIQQILTNASALEATSDAQEPWESAYNLVFSDAISRQVHTTLRSMNHRLDYYDPDTSYEEDVQAFAAAVNRKVTLLEQLLRTPSPEY